MTRLKLDSLEVMSFETETVHEALPARDSYPVCYTDLPKCTPQCPPPY